MMLVKVVQFIGQVRMVQLRIQLLTKALQDGVVRFIGSVKMEQLNVLNSMKIMHQIEVEQYMLLNLI